MRIYPHFNAKGAENSYLIGPDEGGDAILIDPADIDTELIGLIESHHYNIVACLITHGHRRHTAGIPKLMKIYDARIYAASPRIAGYDTVQLSDGDSVEIAGFEIKVRSLPGHSPDSLIYMIGKTVFTGDVLSAGRIGTTKNNAEKQILLYNLINTMMRMDDNSLIYPGHGAATKLRTERIFNYSLLESEVKLY